MSSSFPGAGDERRKNMLPASNPILIPSTSNNSSASNSNLDWSLPPSSPLSPLNSHHTASPPTDLPVDIRPGSPTSLLSIPMPNTAPARGTRTGSVRPTSPLLNSPLLPLSPTPSIDLSSPETIQFALPSDFEPEQSQSDNEEEKGETPMILERKRERQTWREGLEGYASDSPSGLRARQQRRIVPPLLILNHKRSSSSGFAQRLTSVSASPSPLATHSRFHSQSSMATFPRDSFIDLEDTLDDASSSGVNNNPNAMYPAPPKLNAAGGGLFRHKQSRSIRSVASASSLFPTFVDPSRNDTDYQAVAPPSPGLNVPFGGGVVVVPPASNTWKMFSRDKDKDKDKEKSSKKKDFPWRNTSDDAPTGGGPNNNIPSTSSSPTLPSASVSLKPPKLKNPRKAAKLKSHTHPIEISHPHSHSSSSSSTVHPLSSQPIPLPFPLPLPPTTNNLDPAARQDLIKKHRKLVKVLGEEPRVVGHLEFIGGSALIPGQGAGLGLHSTYTPSASNLVPSRNHHHHHAASASISPSNSDPLGTFLHLHPHKQKREREDRAWAENGTHGDTAHFSHHYTDGNTNANEISHALDRAHEQLLHHEPTNSSSHAYDNSGAYQLKRRHSTPITSEFMMDEVTTDETGLPGDILHAEKNDNANKDKRTKDHRWEKNSPRTRSQAEELQPIFISPTSPVPSAPTRQGSRVSIFGSPTSDLSFSHFPPGDAVSAYLREEEEGDLHSHEGLADEESRVQLSNARSPFISPSSSSSPPILPPLTTSPPRLRIDPGLFQNPNPFSDSSVSDSALPAAGVISTALRVVDPVCSLHMDTTDLKDDLKSGSGPVTIFIDKEKKGSVQGHDELLSRSHDRNVDTTEDPLASQALSSFPSKSYTHPLVIPLSGKAQPHSSSHPSTPYSVVRLKDRIPGPVPRSSGGSGPLAIETRAVSIGREETDSKAPGLPPNSALSTLSVYPWERGVRSKMKERSKDKIYHVPVGPATFVAPPSTNAAVAMDGRRRTPIRTRPNTPESFMDLGDDDIESPDGVVDRDESLRQEQRGQGISDKNATSDVNSHPSTPYSPRLSSPLSAVSAPTVTLAIAESKAEAMDDQPLEESPSLSSSSQKPQVHRMPSTTSLAPSLSSLLSMQSTSASPEDLHPYSQVLSSEQEKRKKIDKLAKLNRFLGDNVPIELVLGESYASKDNDLPASAIPDGARLVSGNSKKPLWLRRRRSSSSAALPGYEEIDRRKDGLDSNERIRHVRRGVKMEQMFGTRPPPDLYLVHARGASQQFLSNTTTSNSQDQHLTSPISPTSSTSQTRPRLQGNMNSSSYKGKSKYSASGYRSLTNSNDVVNSNERTVGGINYAYANAHVRALEASGGPSGRSPSKSTTNREYAPLTLLFTPSGPLGLGYDVPSPSRRPGSGDSNKPLLAFGQDIPVGGRLRDEPENFSAVSPGGRDSFDPDNGSLRSSVYMQYRQSLISLGDIVDKDDKASLAEFHQYLQLPHSTSRTGLEYGLDDSDDSSGDDDESSPKVIHSQLTDQNGDALATPTQLTRSSPRSPNTSNTPHSTKGEPSNSPPLTRRRSLPCRASTLSLVSTLSGTSTLSSVSTLSTGTTTTGISRGLAEIPGYYNAPCTEAEGRAARFKARRRRAAKLTNFFGVKYRDLFGEVLESIEAGMKEDARVGRMGVVELEELMIRVKKLRIRRDQFN